MKISLNPSERMLLVGFILPSEGNYITVKMVRNIVDRIGLKPEEFQKYGVTILSDNSVEIKDISEVIEYEFQEKEKDLIVEALKKLDSEKKLPSSGVPLYEKFIEV